MSPIHSCVALKLAYLLLLTHVSHQFRALQQRTRTTANPCFDVPDSSACLGFIAIQRSVSLDEARALVERARILYAAEDTAPGAVYERSTVAIACLASAGTLQPGPDSDCAACGPACTAENRAHVCDLYCTRPAPTTARTGSDKDNSVVYIKSQTTRAAFASWAATKRETLLTGTLASFVVVAILIAFLSATGTLFTIYHLWRYHQANFPQNYQNRVPKENVLNGNDYHETIQPKVIELPFGGHMLTHPEEDTNSIFRMEPPQGIHRSTNPL